MNSYKLICFFLCFYTFAYSQHTDIYFTNFDHPNSELVSVYIDSSYHNNIWQAGNPKKYFFKVNPPDTTSMVTLLTKAYPANNISRFTVVFKPELLPDNIERFNLRFSYQIDTDTLKDFGYVEVSPDMGKTWDNLSSNQSKYILYRLLRGSEYDSFYFSGRDVAIYNGMPNISFGLKGDFLKCNTLMFRFNFISDSIDIQKEGWCINEVFLSIMGGNGIEDKSINNDLISIYNHGDRNLFFKLQNKIISNYFLVDINGKIIKQSTLSNSSATIQCDELPAGYYTLVINDVDGVRYFKKVVLY